MPPYEYQDLAAGTIRLLTIKTEVPGNQSPFSSRDMLNCSVEDFSLSNPPGYFALSYVWGSSELRIPILLNGGTFWISENLSFALDVLRRSNRLTEPLEHNPISAQLWVDAICINQQKDSEKVEQIKQMPKIYQSAIFVVAWLGPQHPEALDSSIHLAGLDKEIATGTLSSDLWSSPQLMKRIQPDIRSGTVGRFLDQVFENRIWNRIWILQELTLAHQVVFLSDYCFIREEVFLPVLFASLEIRIPLAARADSSAVLVRQNRSNPFAMIYSRLRHRLPNPGPMRLEELLLHTTAPTSHFISTDPRDMIYALLGLASDSDILQIVPDYTKHWTEVYREVAVKFIQKDGLGILTFAGSSITNAYLSAHLHLISGHYLPSWVPDWRQRRLIQLGNSMHDHAVDDDPDIGSSAPLYQLEVLANGLHTLKLRGYGWDTVENHGQVWLNDHPGRSIEAAQRWLDELDKIANDSHGAETLGERYSKSAAIWSPIAIRANSLDHAAINEYVAAYNHLRSAHDYSSDSAPTYDEHLEKSKLYLKEMYYKADRRRAFITSTGWIGLGPADIKEGDMVCMFPSYDGHFIVRKIRDAGTWVFLIGEAYLHGLTWELLLSTEPEASEFHLA